MKLVLLATVLAFPALAKPPVFDHTHAQWTRVLKEHVKMDGSTSTINYAGIKGARKDLDQYLLKLERVPQSLYDGFTREEKMAFLINAYNAFTVKLIVDNYPLKSIKDLGGLFSSPWKKEFFKLLGKKRHLDYIEHEVLRKMGEPRIHFAVNCASIGCPALKNTAFTAKHLDKDLEEMTVLFLQDSGRNRYDPKEQKLYLSKIFDWFEEDFEKNGSTVHKFVAKRITKNKQHRKEILKNKPKIKYTDYDWNLNETRQNAPAA